MPAFPLAFYIGGEIFSMISQSGPVGLTVLVLLLVTSIFSWTIIVQKLSLIRRARAQSARFIRAFRKAGTRLQDVASVSDQFKPSPLVEVFDSGYEEYRRQAGLRLNTSAIQRATQIASSEELTRFEQRLPWLATIGAIAPFIGLFGTVWGIIDAFHGLGTEGSATLRAVAPGISEALIATAAGLFAAIPAVVAYNQFSASIREFAARMDDFSLEFLNVVEHNAAAGHPRPQETYREVR